jgi:hypothetical protein
MGERWFGGREIILAKTGGEPYKWHGHIQLALILKFLIFCIFCVFLGLVASIGAFSETKASSHRYCKGTCTLVGGFVKQIHDWRLKQDF